MLGFVLHPIRSALGVVERDMTAPFEPTEQEMLGAVQAIHRATDSIEHRVEVIEASRPRSVHHTKRLSPDVADRDET